MLAALSYEDYGGWRENSRKQLLNLFGRADVDLSPRTALTASLNYSDRDSEVPNAIPVDRNGRVVDVIGGEETFIGFGEPRNQTEGLIGQLRLTHKATEALTLAATVQGRRFEQDLRLNFFDPFGTDLTRNVAGFNGFRGQSVHKVLFGEATAEWRGGAHTLIAGVSAERSKSRSLDSWSGQNGFTPECGFAFYLVEVDYTTGAVLNADHPCFVTDDPLTRDRFEDTFVGAFVQDEIALGERWRLTLGLRYDSFKRRAVVASPPTAVEAPLEGDADAFSPKASLSYRYDGGQAYIAYGRGFSSNFGPTFEWDAVQYARPDNKPSKLDSYEIGLKGRLLDGALQYEAAAFYTEQTNRRAGMPNPAAEVDFTAPGTLIVFGSKYRSRGAELALTWRPTDATRLTAQYSWLDPEWKDYVVETFAGPVDLSGRTPRGVAKNVVYLAAEQQFSDWIRGQATLEVYDDYAVTEDNRIEAGAYELLTLNVRISPPQTPNLTLDLTVNNALDEDYHFYFGGRTNPTYATPGTPRQVRATLRATF
ncbi:TonB-dependent receptor [Phenylobacterium sp. J426]|uniref:TonB-dependent receptor n=1 Tax=Phenylobacterium sp. J426 TaxID=2898439 RepID=UPI0021516BEC|nr:TonB-dependent receptor [Phenylobacterium sp. J426]MCR5876240.1 TonB-dependent receptor [Phenylobacterium sp. J426]